MFALLQAGLAQRLENFAFHGWIFENMQILGFLLDLKKLVDNDEKVFITR